MRSQIDRAALFFQRDGEGDERHHLRRTLEYLPVAWKDMIEIVRYIFTQKCLTFYWRTKKKAGNNYSRGLRETELLSAEPMTLSHL